MKKKLVPLLAALAMLIAPLLAAVATAPSASALACSNFLQKNSGVVYYNHGEGTWRIQAVAGFQYCTTSSGDQLAKMNQYIVNFQQVGSGCDNINGFKVNPDQLGNVNPPEKDVNDCTPGNVSFAVAGAVVWQNSPADQRCVSGTIKPKIALLPDPNGFSIPNICVI